MTNKIEIISPDWPAQTHVRAFSTTRAGGVAIMGTFNFYRFSTAIKAVRNVERSSGVERLQIFINFHAIHSDVLTL